MKRNPSKRRQEALNLLSRGESFEHLKLSAEEAEIVHTTYNAAKVAIHTKIWCGRYTYV